MSNPPARGPTHDLTRIGLVLSHPRARRAWLARGALVIGGVLVGAAAATFYAAQPHGDPQSQAAATQDRQQLQHTLEQNQLTLRMAEARSQELERQIESLIQQVRECREELTFFRKARDGKR